MNSIRALAFTSLLIVISLSALAQEIHGKITEKNSGNPIPGCSIYIPDLKTGGVSDEKGYYSIRDLPKGVFIVQFRSIGYTAITRNIDFNGSDAIDIQLDPRVMETGEVVITGTAFTSDAKRMSMPVESIERAALQEVAAPNLSQALEKIPGVSTLSTGAGIGKPVIRGLGLNRVVTVNQGIRQEGQQWGEEHGLEIDQFAADRIEVMKGPASLQYGSDALGGIVNILEPITPAPGEMRGVLNSQYSSNNRLYGGSVMAEGNRNGFVARFRASGKSAASFRTPVERVYNSGFDELSQSLMVGANKKWGYSHFQLSHWQSDLGLTEGARNEAGEFVDDEGNVIPKDVLDSRKISQPSQLIEHTKISSTNNLILGKSQLRINAGWQLNQRQEFEESPDAPSIHMRLRTFTNDIRYYPMLGKGWEVASGASFMFQENQNLGQEYLIPDYEQQ
ncbi:MAG: TonB-dependent receptor, partial [Bacteroidota bacterium]